MLPFSFIHVNDADAAIHAAGPLDKFLGGGTNLIDLMKQGVERPPKLIDINSLPMQQVEKTESGGLRIGANVRNSDLAYHPEVVRHYPVLSQALLAGASPQLRNMATVGGNIMQRTRCPYFFDISYASCNKRTPGSGCAAINGYNRNHAVLGTSEHCIATHPSDMCVAMAALGAIIHIQGASGVRTVPFNDFHLVPGDMPHKETLLLPGELITAVELPFIPFAENSHYVKVRDRNSYEFALAAAAVVLHVQDGKIEAARIALGGVGTKPWRSEEAEEVLVGANANEKTFAKAADAALKGAVTHKFNAFKPELAKRTLMKALLQTQNAMV